MAKKEFRKQMMATLKTINKDEHALLSQRITEHLLNTEEFKNANIIGITISRYPEVDTRLIIEVAWSMGKQIVVPKSNKETRDMDFRLLTSFDNLETVYLDLLEPIIEKTESILKEHIDLQIVPGVVFSRVGYRTGFGGGYYDRYLADYKGNTLSLAFECQTGHDVPVEAHDLPVDKIVTDKCVINCLEIREIK